MTFFVFSAESCIEGMMFIREAKKIAMLLVFFIGTEEEKRKGDERKNVKFIFQISYLKSK